MRRVPFLDLRVVDEPSLRALLARVERVLRHGRIVLGPEVAEFEQRVAEYCGRRYGVGVNSGSDAIYLGLRSIGIGPGDEVITTSLSWIATANAIALTGAQPVFADIRDDLNMDPASVRRLITARTKAILVVHYTGKLCDMDALQTIAGDYGLALVEDAAQAFGASRQGRRAGSFGAVGCFSMNPMKVLAACGEAGAVVTDDEAVRDRLMSLRYNGTINRETCVEPSVNGRLDTIQAAILLERLREFEPLVERRREIAVWYTERLKRLVATPLECEGDRDVFYTYQIRTDRRDELKAFLDSRGVETKIQHPILMPEQPTYRSARRADIPNATRLVRQILCIPAHEKLTHEDMTYVVDTISEFFGA